MKVDFVKKQKTFFKMTTSFQYKIYYILVFKLLYFKNEWMDFIFQN